MGDQEGLRAHPRGSRSRFTAGVAAADHYDVQGLHPRPPGLPMDFSATARALYTAKLPRRSTLHPKQYWVEAECFT